MKIVIRFVNFWSGFEPDSNFFTRYLKNLGHEIEITDDLGTPADIEFVSVFPSRKEVIQNKIKNYLFDKQSLTDRNLRNTSSEVQFNSKVLFRVWFTGENIRPPLHIPNIDYFLSYDQDDFGDRNLYLPLWLLNFDWFQEENLEFRTGLNLKPESFVHQRKLASIPDKLACTFISNPHPFRLDFMSKLDSLGTVDMFGKYVNKPVDKKSTVAKNYKYMVCFENDLYPGYVTEKLLDAYACGTVPIYWGDLGRETVFNEKAFLNLKNFVSMDALINEINEHDYVSMHSEPLFKQIPTLDQFSTFANKLINRIEIAKGK